MTTDELKKEAEEYLKQKLEERKDKFVFELPEVYIKDVTDAYLVSAEPREKQIQEKDKKIAELEKEIKILTQNLEDTEICEKALIDKVAELKESYFYTRCIRSNCPYIHKENRNCTKFGGFFTAVGNGDCPMMKNLNANIKLDKSKELIRTLLLVAYNKVSQMEFQLCVADAKQFLSEVEK